MDTMGLSDERDWNRREGGREGGRAYLGVDVLVLHEPPGEISACEERGKKKSDINKIRREGREGGREEGKGGREEGRKRHSLLLKEGGREGGRAYRWEWQQYRKGRILPQFP